jgi:hypothetical protein
MITTLFCPSCGTANSTDQSFCRSCGLNLEKSAESLFEQMPPDVELAPRDWSRALERFGDFAFTGLAVVVGAGVAAILYTIVTKMVLSGSQPYAGALLALFVLFAGLALGYVFWRESLEDAKKRGRSTRPNEISAASARSLLPEERPFDPVPSVVEGTTKRLKITKDFSKKH